MIPMDYTAQNYLNMTNIAPGDVKGKNNINVQSQKRYLWNMIYSTLDFTLPKTWALNWFRYWLLHCGSVAVINTDKYGWIAQPYGVEKLDINYQPKKILVTSSYLDYEQKGVIGEDAEIIKIFDDYYGLDDLVTQYATMLSDIDKSININLMNSNVAFLFEADNKKEGDTIKEAYGKATTGEPLVVMNKKTVGDGLKPFFPNVKTNFITTDLIDAKHNILNEFLTKIGIKNANSDKKERLISDEVNANNDATSSIISVIYKNIKESMDRVNEISGLGLAVKLNYEYGGVADVETDTLRTV